MGVKVSFSGSIMTALIEGDIDHHSAAKIREAIDIAIAKEKPKILKLDFGGVSFMDSSGIGRIMGVFKLFTSRNGKLKVINIPKNLERMIKLSGLISLGIF